MDNRIKLAEAMGPRWVELNDEGRFDPFTDANDDYAVLEWMRYNYQSWQIELAFDHIGQGHRWAYETGNNAEACLALISGEVEKCRNCAALKVFDFGPIMMKVIDNE